MKKQNRILSILTFAAIATTTLAVTSASAEIRHALHRDYAAPNAKAGVSPKNQGYHYNRNAETFYEVGDWLGRAMAELLKRTK